MSRLPEGQGRGLNVAIRYTKHDDPVQGVACDEAALLALDEQGDAALVRLWQNAAAIVVGRGYDRGLPRSPEWVGPIPVVVRTSGGEVVVHGPGILNVSLAFAASAWTGTIEEAFAALSQSVAGALRHLGFDVAIGEVEGAYCPGRHDISAFGRKVMGISQRRMRQGILVHGTLNVHVDPKWIGDMLVRFHREARLDESVRTDLIGSLAPGDYRQWDAVCEAVGDALVAKARSLVAKG